MKILCRKKIVKNDVDFFYSIFLSKKVRTTIKKQKVFFRVHFFAVDRRKLTWAFDALFFVFKFLLVFY